MFGNRRIARRARESYVETLKVFYTERGRTPVPGENLEQRNEHIDMINRCSLKLDFLEYILGEKEAQRLKRVTPGDHRLYRSK